MLRRRPVEPRGRPLCVGRPNTRDARLAAGGALVARGAARLAVRGSLLIGLGWHARREGHILRCLALIGRRPGPAKGKTGADPCHLLASGRAFLTAVGRTSGPSTPTSVPRRVQRPPGAVPVGRGDAGAVLAHPPGSPPSGARARARRRGGQRLPVGEGGGAQPPGPRGHGWAAEAPSFAQHSAPAPCPRRRAAPTARAARAKREA